MFQTFFTTVAIVLLLGIAYWIGTIRWKKKAHKTRALFLQDRERMPDTEYLQELGLHEQKSCTIAIIARKAVASELNLDAELIHPADCIGTLWLEISWPVPDITHAVRTALRLEYGTYDDAHELILATDEQGPLVAEYFRDFVMFYINHLDRLTQNNA